MSLTHGVNVNILPTKVVPPVNVSNSIPFIVGTAPVVKAAEASLNSVQLITNKADYVRYFGDTLDIGNYTLAEAAKAAFDVLNVSPLLMVNVLDPSVHKTDVPATPFVVDTKGKVKIDTLVDKSTVSVTGSGGSPTYTPETDYVTSFVDDDLILTIITSGGISNGDTVDIAYSKLDPTAVAGSDIIGTVNVNGEGSGLQLIDETKSKTGIAPQQIIVPKYNIDDTVRAAMIAASTDISGLYSAQVVADIPSDSLTNTLQKALTWKSDKGISLSNVNLLWPRAAVGDDIYHASTIYAMQRMAINGDSFQTLPYKSVSNKAIPITSASLDDGTAIFYNIAQANLLNDQGVITLLNQNGWRFFGNATSAYPGSTDPVDRFTSISEFNHSFRTSLIDTYFQFVDDGINQALIGTINASLNDQLIALANNGAIVAGEAVLLTEDNTTTQLLNAQLTFRANIAYNVPAEQINFNVQFDTDALASALGG